MKSTIKGKSGHMWLWSWFGIFISFFMFYFDKVSLCNPCRLGLFSEAGPCYVAQVGLSFPSVRTMGVHCHIQPVLEDGVVSNELKQYLPDNGEITSLFHYFKWLLLHGVQYPQEINLPISG